MNTQNTLKIKKAVQDAGAYPDPTIEYNFDENINIDLFEDINAVENKKMERNSAKVIYKLI